MIKLSTWAKRNNVRYTTTWRWVRAGKFPGRTFMSETGRVFVIEDETRRAEENGTPPSSTAGYRTIQDGRRFSIRWTDARNLPRIVFSLFSLSNIILQIL